MRLITGKSMSTPLYPTFRKRVDDVLEQLIKQQVTPWAFMTAGPPFSIKSFDGREIAYQGIAFAGSPREVFWSRYIEPFLEQLCISEIEAAVSMAREKGVDVRFLLPELQGLLSSGFRKVYERMADVDRGLRGKGFPNSVTLRSVEPEIQHMDKFLDERILAEVEMWRVVTMSELEPERPCLIVSQEEAAKKLQIQVGKAQVIVDSLQSARAGIGFGLEAVFEKAKTDQEKWAKYTADLLRGLSNNDSLASEFGDYWIRYSLHGDQVMELVSWMRERIARIQSIIERLPLFPMATKVAVPLPVPAREAAASKDVFIVHGHDSEAKLEIARFLEKLRLNPIILHELPDKGRTIIEKFEANTNVCFAIVLLTPDDIGHPRDDASKAKPRARQNVILELGFFVGRLGRHRVCALRKGDIEIPTDYSGVLYKTLDEQGGWKFELAREIKQAGIEIDVNRAL